MPGSFRRKRALPGMRLSPLHHEIRFLHRDGTNECRLTGTGAFFLSRRRSETSPTLAGWWTAF
ncbi:hypothetical protein KM92DES2_20344 [uncultured Desulfovibrio sp.]|uniref:Uncharacterized protein n=1 Tax=uncultured Desulfovibrio sp. TaxID=167968 RepID=A0A212KK74_9BACT|nr:hypothetical protein KM92DES2_20344 [uncultured Desulfovibrio sp.]